MIPHDTFNWCLWRPAHQRSSLSHRLLNEHESKWKWQDNSHHKNDFIVIKISEALPSSVNNYCFGWWLRNKCWTMGVQNVKLFFLSLRRLNIFIKTVNMYRVHNRTGIFWCSYTINLKQSQLSWLSSNQHLLSAWFKCPPYSLSSPKTNRVPPSPDTPLILSLNPSFYCPLFFAIRLTMSQGVRLSVFTCTSVSCTW